MAVFRVEKTDNYTVMSNYHLRDKSISLKAKGLLSQMLSLPPEWDYTLQGLAYINKEGINSVREGVKELEKAGYIKRRRVRGDKGLFAGNEYVIRELPESEKPSYENRTLDNRTLENPTYDKMSVTSDEYFHRYEKLQILLERAYVDVYCLQEIDNYSKEAKNDNQKLPNSSFNVLSHICSLLKVDLAITIWKVFSDDNSKANTIPHLSQYLAINFADTIDVHAFPKKKLTKCNERTKRQLDTFRQHYLAHNDSIKQSVSLQLAEMVDLVEELREKLNALCFPNVNQRAKIISDKRLVFLKSDVSFGLGFMINRSTIPIEDND